MQVQCTASLVCLKVGQFRAQVDERRLQHGCTGRHGEKSWQQEAARAALAAPVIAIACYLAERWFLQARPRRSSASRLQAQKLR